MLQTMAHALQALRAATSELHAQLDAHAYSRALLDGSLSIAEYASFLRALWIVHGELEAAFEQARDPLLRGLLDPSFFARRGLLEQDLAALDEDLQLVDAAALQALVLGQTMRLASAREPSQLAGYAYVLEGSQLGGLMQHRSLRTRPELQHGGLRYLAGAGSETRTLFQAFVSRLETAVADEANSAAAIAAARTLFQGFGRILDAVTSTRTPRALASELNREAGTHAVPMRVREVEAALAAGERSFRENAYYSARYGEKGLRFTRSDSAWLVTLTGEQQPEHFAHHVMWLARVLAARGMPRRLLERHLLLLHDALLERLPSEGARYRCLRTISDQLRREREEALPDADALSPCFTPSAPAIIPAREAAELALAAVADERCGVPNAVSSLTAWLCDRARFDATWVQGIEELMQRARASGNVR